eukprot:c9341_g1_i1 orf=344-1768(+)
MVELDAKFRSAPRLVFMGCKALEVGELETSDRGRAPYFGSWVCFWRGSSLLMPMKVRVLMFCCVSLLLMCFVMIYPMIRIHPTLRRPFIVWSEDVVSPEVIFVRRLNHSAFSLTERPVNRTWLSFAEVDLSEPAERRQINQILDVTWGRGDDRRHSWRDRTINRFERDMYDQFDMGGRPSGRRATMPIQLTSPRYKPYQGQFRRSLQGWVQNKHYDPQIMKQLLRLVKDPVDKHYIKKGYKNVELGKPYKACAVVGNSGILLNRSYASLIDSHDMVMRLNNARITGFERFVGSKTTLAFVNSNILNACSHRSRCLCHPYGENVPMIVYLCQVVHFMDVALCGASHQSPIIVTDPRFDILCSRIVKYYSLRNFVESTGRPPEDWSHVHDGPMFHYSSGMQAIMLALGLCEDVSIFGFGKSPTAKHHYHTNQKAELHLHDYEAEYQFYYDLTNQKSEIIPFLSQSGFTIPHVEIYL